MSWLFVVISVLFFLLSLFFIFRSLRAKKARRQAVSELQSFENIVAHTNDSLIVIEIVNGKILHINNAAAELMGYQPAELMNKTYFELVPKEFLHQSAEVIADVWEN